MLRLAPERRELPLRLTARDQDPHLVLLLGISARRGNASSELTRLETAISTVEAEPGRLDDRLPAAHYPAKSRARPTNAASTPCRWITATPLRARSISLLCACSPPAKRREAPIVFLAGGPGQSGILAAGRQLYGDLRDDRDLIFPAQRGTLFGQRLALEECVDLLGDQLGPRRTAGVRGQCERGRQP